MGELSAEQTALISSAIGALLARWRGRFERMVREQLAAHALPLGALLTILAGVTRSVRVGIGVPSLDAEE